MAKICLDGKRNPIKQGFYTKMVDGGIHYFNRQTTTVIERAEKEEVDCWEVYTYNAWGEKKAFVGGAWTGFLDTTKAFFPLSEEEVRREIGYLGRGASLLRRKLGDIVRGVEVTVGALVFNSEAEMILLESPKWNTKYIVPCGHVEPGERLEDAVKREVKEETGLNVYDIQFLMLNELITSKEFHDERRHFVTHNYTCRTRGRKVRLNKEATGFIWTPPTKALELDIDQITRASLEEYFKR